MNGRRLVLMRHASAMPHAPSDAARPLTPKGRSTAAHAGEVLRSLGIAPDHVLVSPARRCTETWEQVEQRLRPEGAVVAIEQAVYAAAPESLLTVLRAVPASARTVMLVGHNPAIAYVASVLADSDGPLEIMQKLLNGLLPGAFAVYETGTEWADLDMLGARPTYFHDGSAG